MTAEIHADTPSFETYHARALPERIARARTTLPEAYRRSLRPFALRVRETGRAFTYRPDDAGGIAIESGDAAAVTAVELSEESFVHLTQDLESAPGLVYGGRAKRLRGDMMDFLQWEPALRWMFVDRPVYDPDDVDLRDAAGRALDPTRGFAPDDDPDEMAEYLRSVGYLWIRGVLSPEEVETLRAEAERLRADAREGDQESWWGKRADGTPVLCRVLRAGKQPTMRSLHGDPRLERFAELCDAPMEHKQGPEDKDGVTVLWKQPGVAEGLGDLPWHRDCGMGGHASMCPTAVLSVFLGPNTPEAGELRFLPGSWQMSYPYSDGKAQGTSAEGTSAAAPRGVAPPAQPGDVTFHYGDGLHVAPPPTGEQGPYRSCVLMGYARVGGQHHLGGRHYNDVLLGSEDGQIQDMRKVAERS